MGRQIHALDQSISTKKIIFLLAWPTVLEQMLQTLVGYVDTAMVGSIGVDATAAVAVNTSIIWMIHGLIMGLGVGVSVLVANAIGRKDAEEAKEIIRQGVLLMGICAVVLVLLIELILAPNLAGWLGAEEKLHRPAKVYFQIVGAAMPFQILLMVCGSIIRSSGDTRSPMFYNLLNNLVNIVGNFLFIYPSRTVELFGHEIRLWGADMGVAGAALGTALAAAVSGLAMGSYLLNKKYETAISLRDKFRWDSAQIKRILILAAPAASERLVLSSGQMVITGLATGLGTSALAAHQLANTAESICYMPVSGFGVAGTTLVAQSLGGGEKETAGQYAKLCLRYSVMVMSVCATLMFIFAPQLMGLFIADRLVIAMGVQVLRIQAFAEPCLAIASVSAGLLRGAGDTKWPFYIAVAGMWIVRISLAVLMIKGFHFGLVGIWIPMAVDWVVRTIVSLRHMKGDKWLEC